MRYQFTRTVVLEGTTHHAGDVVYGSSLPEGALGGLLRMGHVVEFAQVVAQVATPEPVEQATPKKPAKK